MDGWVKKLSQVPDRCTANRRTRHGCLNPSVFAPRATSSAIWCHFEPPVLFSQVEAVFLPGKPMQVWPSKTVFRNVIYLNSFPFAHVYIWIDGCSRPPRNSGRIWHRMSAAREVPGLKAGHGQHVRTPLHSHQQQQWTQRIPAARAGRRMRDACGHGATISTTTKEYT